MPQEVILISDVPGLGQLGEQHKVKEGYARNYLIPRKLAIFATGDALKRFEKQKAKLVAAREKQLETSKTLAEKIAKVGLVFERTLGAGGRLYGSVTPHDIANELARQGVSVEKKSVLMHAALKSTGDHTIRVRIHSKVVVDLPIKIVGKEANKAEGAVDVPVMEEDTTPFGVADDD
jgi:large subunit ribosomal protein L9